MMCPKAIGTRLNEKGERCALGAAEFGAGVNVNTAERYWPALNHIWAIHPELKIRWPLIHIVVSLNNGWYHREFNLGDSWKPWTREQIAHWYTQFEAEAEAEAEVAPDERARELSDLAFALASRPEPVPADFFEPVVSLAA